MPMFRRRAYTIGARRARRIALRFGSDTKGFWQMIDKAASRKENRRTERV